MSAPGSSSGSDAGSDSQPELDFIVNSQPKPTRPRSFIQTDILNSPEAQIDLIQEGPFATVSRTWASLQAGHPPQWVVIKSASTLRKFAREPHDIVKELRLLRGMVHLNIVYVLGSFHDKEQKLLSIYMPYLPISLSAILASPYFTPHPLPQFLLQSPYPSPSPSPPSPTTPTNTNLTTFLLLTKSILLQTLSALAFLHDEQRRIAHRDIKPANILLTEDGCVKLIDFGVAFKEREEEEERRGDLWAEGRGRMYFEVSTGAYRAPELLFGTRTYDPCAIDLWSLGATFAEFFTPLRLTSLEEDDGDDDDDTELSDGDVDPDPNAPEGNANAPKSNAKASKAYIIPKYLRVGYPGAEWKRDTLFNGERGEIGLAWSIFKLFGSPNEVNWPEFKELPGANAVVFNVVEEVPLEPLLPNLPTLGWEMADATTSEHTYLETPNSTSSSSTSSSSSHTSPPQPPQSTPFAFHPHPHPILSLLRSFLVYPSASRVRAEDAMRHPFFTRKDDLGRYPVVLPRGYAVDRNWGWLRGVSVVDGVGEGGEGGGHEGEGRAGGEGTEEPEWLRRMGGLRGMIGRVLHGVS